MSLSMSRGSAHLCARVFLENRRVLRRDSETIVFDVLIHTAETVNGSNVICSSLEYGANSDMVSIEGGLYDIFAKVRFYTGPFSYLAHISQIVSFRSGVHPASPTRSDSDFAFMGDILEVCFHLILRAFV